MPNAPEGVPANTRAFTAYATQIFDDEFDGASLDRVWSTCYPWASPKKGCTNGGDLELEWYLPGNVSLSSGDLNLTAKVQTAHGGSSPATMSVDYVRVWNSKQ